VTGGAASAIALGTLSIVGGQMVLGRDAGGLYAMSGLCTHQGCLVSVVGAPGQQTLACPCHGSAFDGNGAVTRGPARTPLAHYQVQVTADGGATICTGVAVASTMRTPVP
jgi:Rieske Fe-S protein